MPPNPASSSLFSHMSPVIAAPSSFSNSASTRSLFMPPSPGSARQKLSTNRLRKVTDEASITIDDRQGAEPISFQDFGRVHQRRVSRDSHRIGTHHCRDR